MTDTTKKCKSNNRAKQEHRPLRFTDDLMFKRVMDIEYICSGVIERVTGRNVESIEQRSTEREIRSSPERKVIRLDSYVVDSGGRQFDVEMQMGFNKQLPLRFRGYQSVLDNSVLWSGKDYDSLMECYVVFICTEDPFKAGIPVYTIERSCIEDPSVGFSCQAHWIALNAAAYASVKDNEGLRSLLEYVATQKVTEGDALIERIDAEVAHNNSDEGGFTGMLLDPIETMKMEARVQARYEGREQGLAEGIAEGRAEGIAEGRAEGIAEGRAKGIAEGRVEGEERFAKLVSALSKQGRIEELERAASDIEERERLYSELGID